MDILDVYSIAEQRSHLIGGEAGDATADGGDEEE